MKVLICGGGCAGPSLAFWLSRSGHDVTIVERLPNLRASGAQIDLRGQGIEVVRRMGLLEKVREKRVNEAGVEFVDRNGSVIAGVMANTSGQGAQSLTSEYEIMRGDLVNILYGATKDNVKYIFGTAVESFEQDDEKVTIHFSNGQTDTFDILVGADGQGSRIRKAILPPDAPDPCHRLGVHAAYWIVPRDETDSNMRKSYLSPGRRWIMRRTHNSTETQAYFIVRDDSPEVSSLHRAPIDTQKGFWKQRFSDAGWQSKRFIDGMDTASNFYSHEAIQVYLDEWYKNRVVLLGDAAYCLSFFSGMGTTGALIGAYILAGEINKSPNDPTQAFVSYQKQMTPFVEGARSIVPTMVKLSLLDSQWAINLLLFVFKLITRLRILELATKFSTDEKGDFKMPDYSDA
ncbi:hypothetical protein TRICI_001992 [Trichomonascus ciferrii]|uniref:FAD-binding domain-containing protein n=1 Tax=Trichomonascus ciferrii TaxID=44093 RepID=A0A642V8F9_9ASCO|nr:hypothetical protein TRICI_001992 [Trichomonascus ciferrii]